MSLTYPQAIDEMYALFYAGFIANTGAVVGYVPEIRYQDDGKAEPDRSKYWVRVSFVNLTDEQGSLSNCVFIPGQKRYESEGFLYVQVFSPKSEPNAAAVTRRLCDVIRRIFRGKTTPGKVWFRNDRIVPLIPDQQFYRSNVVTEYQYDEIG